MPKLARFLPLFVALSACGVDSGATYALASGQDVEQALAEAPADLDEEALAETVMGADSAPEATHRLLDPSARYTWLSQDPTFAPSPRCVNTLVKLVQDARALHATGEWGALRQSVGVQQLSGDAGTLKRSCSPRRFSAACTQSLKQLGHDVKVVATSREMRAVRATEEFRAVVTDVQAFVIQGCLHKGAAQ
jgi:hypothetical protein